MTYTGSLAGIHLRYRDILLQVWFDSESIIFTYVIARFCSCSKYVEYTCKTLGTFKSPGNISEAFWHKIDAIKFITICDALNSQQNPSKYIYIFTIPSNPEINVTQLRKVKVCKFYNIISTTWHKTSLKSAPLSNSSWRHCEQW